MPCLSLTDRALLRLSGADTRPFLQNLLTQDLDQLSAEQPLHAAMLSPQGKALFQLFLFADGDDVLLDVAAADRDALLRRLLMFRLRSAVDIAPERALAVWQQWGEASSYPADPRLPEAGSRFVAPPDALPVTAVDEDWQQHRLGLGLPSAAEIGHDDLLWLETNARELNGVSFTKGCYVGQENTARMHHRDRLRKRLLPVAISAELAPGTPIEANGRKAGALRGKAHGGLQMALLRMADIDAPLTAGGQPVQPRKPDWLA